jgi:hypothetical protein
MKSHLRLALLAGLFPASALATDAYSLDVYGELVRYRTQHHGAARTFNGSTSQFLAKLLNDPLSPYSSLEKAPAFTNEIWWPRFVYSLPTSTDNAFDETLDALQWQTGVTKARPGIELTVGDDAITAFRGREVAANALKAGVDADIFWKARDMNGSLLTEAAGHAVALQILRDQMRYNDPAHYDALAIKPDVLKRYLAQTNPDRISEYDQRYLADLLRHALATRYAAPGSGTQRRQLPAVYRVARVAAAYSDARGYYNSNGYCAGTEPRPGEPTGEDSLAYHRPLCFIAATDRSVQAWFRRELRLEASGARLHEEGHHGFSHVLHWLGTVLVLIDFAAFIETADALIAEDLAAEGAIPEEDAAIASERATRLTCRIHP